MRNLTLFASSLLLASCAHYGPMPISDPGSSAALQPPVAAVLSQEASSIDRPYLAPVAIDLSAPLDPNEIAIIAVLSNPDLQAMRVRAGVCCRIRRSILALTISCPVLIRLTI